MGQGSHKYIPHKPVRVLIVDDMPEGVQTMKETLESWEKVEVNFYHALDHKVPDVRAYDIVLLDHYMPIKGRECARIFREEQDYTGIIASISSVENQFEYATAWFSHKHHMHADDLDFINWFNDLLLRS
jgi:CheY-like chemotaxis protein